MKRDGRDRGGRFAKGNKGGPGRPSRANEAGYLQALGGIVSLDDLRAIARRAVADAKKGSARAREWVSRYLLGVPAPARRPRPDGRRRAMMQTVRDELSQELTAAGSEGDPAPPNLTPQTAAANLDPIGQDAPPTLAKETP